MASNEILLAASVGSEETRDVVRNLAAGDPSLNLLAGEPQRRQESQLVRQSLVGELDILAGLAGANVVRQGSEARGEDVVVRLQVVPQDFNDDSELRQAMQPLQLDLHFTNLLHAEGGQVFDVDTVLQAFQGGDIGNEDVVALPLLLLLQGGQGPGGVGVTDVAGRRGDEEALRLPIGIP